jgi:hypothetical protein
VLFLLVVAKWSNRNRWSILNNQFLEIGLADPQRGGPSHLPRVDTEEPCRKQTMPKKKEWDKWIDDITKIKTLHGFQRFSDGIEVEFKNRKGIIYYKTQGEARYRKIVTKERKHK